MWFHTFIVFCLQILTKLLYQWKNVTLNHHMTDVQSSRVTDRSTMTFCLKYDKQYFKHSSNVTSSSSPHINNVGRLTTAKQIIDSSNSNHSVFFRIRRCKLNHFILAIYYKIVFKQVVALQVHSHFHGRHFWVVIIGLLKTSEEYEFKFYNFTLDYLSRFMLLLLCFFNSTFWSGKPTHIRT
jgi:hypothetical protein